MKLFILFLCLAMCVCVASAQQKIAYIQSDVLLKQIPEVQQADSVLSALSKKWQDTLNMMQQKYQEISKQLDAATTADARRNFRAQSEQLQQQGNAYNSSKFGAQGELTQQQQALLTPVRQRINAAIEKLSKEQHIDFVFDKSSGIGLLYGADTWDISYQVLDMVNTGINFSAERRPCVAEWPRLRSEIATRSMFIQSIHIMKLSAKYILLIACLAVTSIAARAQKIAYVQSDVILKAASRGDTSRHDSETTRNAMAGTLLNYQKQIQDKNKTTQRSRQRRGEAKNPRRYRPIAAARCRLSVG